MFISSVISVAVFQFQFQLKFWTTRFFSYYLVSVILFQFLLQFSPCDAMRCTVLVIVILSVCLSITLVDCVHMVWPTIVISSPYGSPIILVSGDIMSIPKFEGGHPERGRWIRVGWVRIGDFRPISRRISETVREQRLLLITNRKSYTRFRLVPKSMTLVDPEMTLDGSYALRCITHMCLETNH